MKEHNHLAGQAGGRVILLLVAVVGILAVSAAALGHWLTSPVGGGAGEQVKVEIPAAASSRQIATILHNSGLIRHPLVFQQYTRWAGMDSSLKAGTYQLTPALSVQQIAGRIAAGAPDLKVFTVPEGYTVSQVAELLDEAGFVDREAFLTAVAETDHPYAVSKPELEGYRRLEGYLFPDTYHVGSKITGQELVQLMLDRFSQEMDQLDYRNKAAALGLTVHEAVTVAAMVEREARVPDERPLIAGVIYNRLRLGMPLQIDATVQYALGEHRAVIYYRDLEVDSPYNTYRISGLPPGPIASPGSASLRAAVEPAASDYLYYVARPDGSHAFSRTLSEHNANKRKYLQ
jgi:UPF0755 protein